MPGARRRRIPDSSPFVTEVQMAELLGLSEKTLKDWRLKGVGLPHVKIHNCILYEKAVAIEHVRKHRVGGETQESERGTQGEVA